jgi:hypothetical protein
MMQVPESADRSNGSGVAPKKRPVHSSVVADAEASEGPAAVAEPASDAEPEPTTTLLPVLADEAPLATVSPGPELKADPGLYAVLGLDPNVSDAEIQTAYRRQASKLLGNGSNDTHALKQLNVAYEVLGNPVRRVEYDRLRLSQSLSPGAPTPIRPGAKATTRITKRRRPRHAVQPRYAGLGDVVVVIAVVGLAVLAGALLIPRLSINLSALNALQSVLPLSNSSRRVLDTNPTSVPATPVATATPLPGVAARFTGSNVSVSNPSPSPNTPENVVIHLRRDGKPAANFDVWATVDYRTVQERWPATGTLKTDSDGAATITFNIGGATPNFPVTVHVFAQVDDQQLSWTTSFTPH